MGSSMVLVGVLYGTLEGGSPTAGVDDVPGALEEYSRGTQGVLEGYSRGTQGVLEEYSRGTQGVLYGYRRSR